jgi:hypothetical protein
LPSFKIPGLFCLSKKLLEPATGDQQEIFVILGAMLMTGLANGQVVTAL